MSQFVSHLRDVEGESMFHVEVKFFLNWLDEICIALGFKLFPCFETLCFSR